MVKKRAKLEVIIIFVEHPYKLELLKNTCYEDSLLFSESHHFRYHW